MTNEQGKKKEGRPSTLLRPRRAWLGLAGIAGIALTSACSGTDEAPNGWQAAPGSEPEDNAASPDSTPQAGADADATHYPLFEAHERARREFAGAHGEPLGQLAAKCDLATGVHVPSFNCSAGTEVPTTHLANGNCDRPNRLNQECDPGSRFQVVAKNADAVAVAHCRKQGKPGNLYTDIAVIQYNKRNGATCFWQALNLQDGMDGNFKAPSLGSSDPLEADTPNPGGSPWISTYGVLEIDCRGCHDNGAIIRSPYLSQLGSTLLPGAGDTTYNRTNPVSYIGKDFQEWEIYSVNVSGNICTGCHRLGVTDTFRSDFGTAMTFGIRATAQSELHKNPHGPDSPIWMIPPQVYYSSANATSATQMKNCAEAARTGATLPSGCSVSLLSTKYKGIDPAQLHVLL